MSTDTLREALRTLIVRAHRVMAIVPNELRGGDYGQLHDAVIAATAALQQSKSSSPASFYEEDGSHSPVAKAIAGRAREQALEEAAWGIEEYARGVRDGAGKMATTKPASSVISALHEIAGLVRDLKAKFSSPESGPTPRETPGSHSFRPRTDGKPGCDLCGLLKSAFIHQTAPEKPSTPLRSEDGCDHGRRQPWCAHCDKRFPKRALGDAARLTETSRRGFIPEPWAPARVEIPDLPPAPAEPPPSPEPRCPRCKSKMIRLGPGSAPGVLAGNTARCDSCGFCFDNPVPAPSSSKAADGCMCVHAPEQHHEATNGCEVVGCPCPYSWGEP